MKAKTVVSLVEFIVEHLADIQYEAGCEGTDFAFLGEVCIDIVSSKPVV